jgi:hypothetical protein
MERVVRIGMEKARAGRGFGHVTVRPCQTRVTRVLVEGVTRTTALVAESGS